MWTFLKWFSELGCISILHFNFFFVAARMIAPPFILNFHILLFLMAKDNHERPAFGIFLKRQRS